jgi:hypothetical protein
MITPPTQATCSAECTQDSDCDGELRDPTNALDQRCASGFACSIPFVVSPLACKKLCICKDFLGADDLTTPLACTQNTNTPSIGSVAGVGQETDIYVAVPKARKLDMVVMVDNSPSMAPKVAKLNAAFPKLIDSLKAPDGTLPDLRLAIIDSDLGTGGAYTSGSCGPKTLFTGTSSLYGDLGRFQMLKSPTACSFSEGAQYLEQANGLANFTGDLSDVFGCLTRNLGTLGCNEEHQLQAFEFALVSKGIGNEQQQLMLRPEASLGLIFLSDEDDCSAASNDGMFGDKPELRGESASLRCATRAHTCSGINLSDSGPGYPTTQAFSTALTNCSARTDACPNPTDGQASTDTSVPTSCSPLRSVKKLADHIKSLKSSTDQILVAGIFGWPRSDADMASAKYKIAPVPNPNTPDTEHPTIYDYWPVCYDPNHMPSPATTDFATGFDATAAVWGATGGLRESAFVDEFGYNGLKFSICEPDFDRPMKVIGESFVHKISNVCIDFKLADAEIATPGLQADCRVVYHWPAQDPEGRVVWADDVLPLCPANASNGNVSRDCWQLAYDITRCPSNGQLIVVLRTADEVAAGPVLEGTRIGAQCRTCPTLASGSASAPGCDY